MQKHGCWGCLATLFGVLYFGYWGICYWDSSRLLPRAIHELREAEKANDNNGYDERHVAAIYRVKELRSDIEKCVFWGADAPIDLALLIFLLWWVWKPRGTPDIRNRE